MHCKKRLVKTTIKIIVIIHATEVTNIFVIVTGLNVWLNLHYFFVKITRLAPD